MGCDLWWRPTQCADGGKAWFRVANELCLFVVLAARELDAQLFELAVEVGAL